MKIKNFFLSRDCDLEDLGEGVKRKVLSYNDNMMCVEVHFEKGAEGKIHSHPHEQITYVLSGKFEFNIDGNKVIIESGDSTYQQPDIPHGVVCIEEGILLDIFTPCRKDFI
ncbi:MAG: cupin domain-containing protein [Eubacteriales bacterium]